MASEDRALTRALADSARTSNFIAENLGDTARLNRKERLAVASLHLSLDHREATLLLAANGARSSAFAMMRPVLESCVRGCWFGFAASEPQIDLLLDGRLSTKLDVMVRNVGKCEPALAVLSTIASTFKDRLDDFTHGSGPQLARWYNHQYLGPLHTAAEMVDVLRFIDTIGLIACAAREKLFGRPAEPFLERLVAASTPERKLHP